MEEISINNKIFYFVLLLILLISVLFFGFELLYDYYVFVGYFVLFGLSPILFISLIVELANNFSKYGFLNGIKETSLNIFSLLICFLVLWNLYSYSFEKHNKFNITIVNQTEKDISKIALVGRNAKSEIDDLISKQSKTFVFKGKRINRKTENDYENEIRLLYYYDGKWRENKILSGFGRWREIDNDWKLTIHNADSVTLVELLKSSIK